MHGRLAPAYSRGLQQLSLGTRGVYNCNSLAEDTALCTTECKTSWEPPCFWNKPFSLKAGDYPDLPGGLGPSSKLTFQRTFQPQQMVLLWLLEPAHRTPTPTQLPPPRTPPGVPRAGRSSQSHHVWSSLSSMPTCSPGQPGWAPVRASTGASLWRGPNTLAALPPEQGCPACCVLSGWNGTCVRGPPASRQGGMSAPMAAQQIFPTRPRVGAGAEAWGAGVQT